MSKKMLLNCVILAGGKSSRMGQDKTLMKFGKYTSLVEFCTKNYSKIFKNVFVSTKSDKFGDKFNIISDKFDIFSPMGALWQILEFFENSQNCCEFSQNSAPKCEIPVSLTCDLNLVDPSISNFAKFDNPNLPIDITLNSNALFYNNSNINLPNNTNSAPDLEKIFIIPADMPFVRENTIFRLYENSANCDIINPKDDFHTHFLCGFFSPNLAQSAKDLFLQDKHKIANLAQISAHKTLNFTNADEFLNINNPQDYQKALEFLAL